MDDLFSVPQSETSSHPLFCVIEKFSRKLKIKGEVKLVKRE